METTKIISFFILLSTVVIGGCDSDDMANYKKMQKKYPNTNNKELLHHWESHEKDQNQRSIAKPENTSHISDETEADISYYRSRFLRTEDEDDNIPPKKKVRFNLDQNKYYDPPQSQNMDSESEEEHLLDKPDLNEGQALRQPKETGDEGNLK